MHLLIIAYYTPPVTSGGSRRPLQIAEHLRKKGHTVTVLTATHDGTDTIDPGRFIRIHDPSHNHNRRGISGLSFWSRRITIELRNHLGIYASIYEGWRKRIKKKTRRILDTVEPDAILATYPPAEDLETGLYIAESTGINLVADFRDGLLFEPIEGTRLDRFSAIRRHYRDLENRIAGTATCILTASDPISRYFENRTPVPVHTLLNGFPDSVDGAAEKPPVSKAKDEPFRIVHTGRLGLSDAGIDSRPFFDSIRRTLQRHPSLTRRLQVHLVGALSSREYRQVRDLTAAGTVIVQGPVSPSQAVEYQKSADLLLTITSTGRRSVISTKFLEYLGREAPILALTAGTEQERILKETRRGWSCPPDSRERISRILEKIILDPDFRQSLIPSQEELRKYSWKNQARVLDTLFPEPDPGLFR